MGLVKSATRLTNSTKPSLKLVPTRSDAEKFTTEDAMIEKAIAEKDTTEDMTEKATTEEATVENAALEKATSILAHVHGPSSSSFSPSAMNILTN
jgi:hypothetical protein